MAKNTLESLISDLDYLERNFDKILDEKYDEIMAMIMLAMGKATAYDTGVSRDLIRGILGELGASDYEYELDHVIWEFWNKKSDREKQGATYSFTKTNGRYNIVINDYGFTNQDEGYVSDFHPRNDRNVVPNQVDYAIDLMETETDKDIERAFRKLDSFIVKALDGVIK